MNQTCFCGTSLTKYQYQWDYPCWCCGIQYNPDKIEFYCCNQSNTCKFKQISTYDYVVCVQCFNSKNHDLKDTENDLKDTENDFIINKTKSNMKIISDKFKTLIDIQKRKKCMYEMYFVLYQSWIAKLQNDALTKEFNEFYNQELEKIKNDTDAHELELNDDIFTNNSNKEFDPQQLAEMNKISLEWFGFLNDSIFTSNSNKEFNSRQLAEMNKISLEWFG
eukprot:112640_1